MSIDGNLADGWSHKRINNIDGIGIIGIARVIARNDIQNQGRVRIYDLSNTVDWKYIEGKNDGDLWAEPMSLAKGENHGIYYTPEMGDIVLYTKLPWGVYIIGSIADPSWKNVTVNMPAEVQNLQKNSLEYLTSFWPNLNAKGYHTDYENDNTLGDKYHPASFLQRWRKNDILMYNTTQILEAGIEADDFASSDPDDTSDAPGHTPGPNALKLMEFRSSENQMLQLVDLGNANVRPGLLGKNCKNYSPVRQTDYRDLWEGFAINKNFWINRTPVAPSPHESQFIKLATNGTNYNEVNHTDNSTPLPDLLRDENRLDDRTNFGGHETSKTYCPSYQILKMAVGPERYLQDKEPKTGADGAEYYKNKVKMWIEDFDTPFSGKNQKFNVGHYLTLSNTIFKRRAMLSTKKGHHLVMSDIDKDEKVLMMSHRGKYLYMEDSDPEHYDGMWLASQKHHMIFCDNMVTPYLIDSNGMERHRLLDPNQVDFSSYQLIQTQKKQKIWLADGPLSPRIHAHSTDGHELLLLDHDSKISPTQHKGKIQLTTSDKMMQIFLDVEKGNLTIQNHNPNGLDIYSKGDMSLKTEGFMNLEANLGFNINSSDGMWIETTNQNITNSDGPGGPVVPTVIAPTVLTDIETTEGKLVNKFNPL